MAIYTQLDIDEIAALVSPLAPGRLIRARGVAAGVENTTYFLDFERGQNNLAHFVLTIAETLSRTDLEFIAQLMQTLSERGLPVPAPAFSGNIFDAQRAVMSIREKPALLVPRVTGSHPQTGTPELCQRVGETLARLHIATLDMEAHHESHRSLGWVEATGRTLLPHLAASEQKLLGAELDALAGFIEDAGALPRAVIHGDLFRDNVLISDDAPINKRRITAFIDFFSAGTGYLLLDLAIAVNDWCFDDRGHFNDGNYAAMTSGYCGARPPERMEIERWPQLLRIAALRFWVSRLSEQLMADRHAPRGRGKDPLPYQALTLRHRDQPLMLQF